jgi:MYXO-CTERM domain-containing protein
MKNPMINLARAGFAAAALTVAGAANAALVFTTTGDPFPAGSEVKLTPDTGPFETPYGFVNEIFLRDFAPDTFPSPSTGNQVYTYAGVTFNNVFFSDATLTTQVGTYQGTTTAFQVQVQSRPGIQAAGSYTAVLQSATFTGTAFSSLAPNGTDGPLVTRIDPDLTTTGTVNFGELTTLNGVSGQYVSSDFSVPGQFGTDLGGPFIDVPMTGTSNPPQVPVPATAAILLPGLIGLAALRRRRPAA